MEHFFRAAVPLNMIRTFAFLFAAIGMWYLPYFRGGSEQQRREYAAMYAGTRQVLPERGENPRPNLLHVCFHVVFVVTLALAILLRTRSA